MGYCTHVFAWKSNDVGEKEADYFYPISIIEKEKILEKCKSIGICGICSIASDLAVITVNYVSEKLELCGNKILSTMKCTNKYAMREAFYHQNDPCPRYLLIDDCGSINIQNLQYPLIVKPTDRSGSRGVCRIENSAELKKAIHHAMLESFEKKVIIEEFVEGQEYSVEYISYRGTHSFLAMTKKFTTESPNYIETGHMEPALVEENILQRVKDIVEHALNTLEIKNGASHTEIKITKNQEIKIIEVGARMGGDCIGSDLVRYSTGYDYIKMVIDIACGQAPSFKKVCRPVAVEIRYIITREDLYKFQELQKKCPNKILKIIDFCPENIGKITDSSNRAGCYIKLVN